MQIVFLAVAAASAAASRNARLQEGAAGRASKLHHTQPKTERVCGYCLYRYITPCLWLFSSWFFFCKSDFCFLIVNCNSERFAKFQVSQWQWNSWDWVVMFCVSFFLFPMFQWHDTKLNPPFVFVSSDNILGFAAADQTFDLGALY